MFFNLFSPEESDKNFSGTGKINFELYSCCYIDKISGELCTTCENIYILSDEPVIYNDLEYTNLKITDYENSTEIYDFQNKKVRVSGKIISSQNNILIIKPIQLSDIKK